MKRLLSIFFATLTFHAFGQDKDNYVHYNKLTDITGTDYVVATVSDLGKIVVNSKYLLFINTKTGQRKQVDFPKDAYIREVQQIRIDSLGINKVIVSGQTVDLDGYKGIDWNDPTQIIIFSPDGQDKTQLTEDKFFVQAWATNRQTGTIVITGHYDTNNNGKYDKTDKNEILIYDLKTLKLITKT